MSNSTIANPVTASTLEPTTELTEFPQQLPGLDITRGLQQLGGNQALYLRCLDHFAQHYDTTAQQLQQHLTAQNYVEADSLLHTFKGVTGNLGAMPLFHLTEQLRQYLQTASAELPTALLQQFTSECAIVFQSIAQLQAFVATQTDRPTTSLTPSEQQKLKQQLAEIAQALRNSEYISIQHLQVLLTLGQKTSQAAQFSQLEHYISHYEHELALALLTQLQPMFDAP